MVTHCDLVVVVAAVVAAVVDVVEVQVTQILAVLDLWVVTLQWSSAAASYLNVLVVLL